MANLANPAPVIPCANDAILILDRAHGLFANLQSTAERPAREGLEAAFWRYFNEAWTVILHLESGQISD